MQKPEKGLLAANHGAQRSRCTVNVR